MKGIKTRKEIEAEPLSTTWRYAFVRCGKDRYRIADVQSGTGYAPIIELRMNPGAANRFFFDLYQQLKGIYEGISEHN